MNKKWFCTLALDVCVHVRELRGGKVQAQFDRPFQFQKFCDHQKQNKIMTPIFSIKGIIKQRLDPVQSRETLLNSFKCTWSPNPASPTWWVLIYSMIVKPNTECVK